MKRPTAIRDKAIVLTLLDTGMRASELCRVLVKDLDLKTGEVEIKPFGTGRKTRSRFVYLGSVVRRTILRYIVERSAQPTENLFVVKGGKPFNRASLYHLIEGLGTRAGVSGCHPHQFRHTFAIEYLRNGGDVFTLQRRLGHSSLEMVQKYLELSQVDDAEAHRKASPADHWSF